MWYHPILCVKQLHKAFKDRHVCFFNILHKNFNHEVNVTMLTYGIITNAIQNEWNIIGSFMSPLRPQNTPWLYQRQEGLFYTGFEDRISADISLYFPPTRSYSAG